MKLTLPNLFMRVTILMSEDIQRKMQSITHKAHPNETGGILVGWWERGNIIVNEALEVADPQATRTSWTRDEHKAQVALDRVLQKTSNRQVGYVGDWHSHPEMCGASSIDINSLKQASKQFDKPLGLVIQLPGNKVDARSSLNGRLLRVKIQFIKNKGGLCLIKP